MEYLHVVHPRGTPVKLYRDLVKVAETYSLHGHNLPANFTYRAYVNTEDGHVWSKSRRGSNGSVRYYGHASLDAALAHGIKWAKRVTADIKHDRHLFA